MSYFFAGEALHQPQHLHILATTVLLETRFEQTPQLSEALRQLPAGQRSSLIQCSRLLFEQRQVVQWIEDNGLAFVTARMPGDDLAGAGDHHFVDVALHPYLAIS